MKEDEIPNMRTESVDTSSWGTSQHVRIKYPFSFNEDVSMMSVAATVFRWRRLCAESDTRSVPEGYFETTRLVRIVVPACAAPGTAKACLRNVNPAHLKRNMGLRCLPVS